MMSTTPSLPVLEFSTIGPLVGSRFPDVRLPDQTGRPVDLHADRAGRWALVVVYRSARW
jgi:peroxiredoxin